MADFVLNTTLDGIDVDWEELDLVVQQPSVGEQWLVTFTQVLRTRLPQGQFILSHARKSFTWCLGTVLAVLEADISLAYQLLLRGFSPRSAQEGDTWRWTGWWGL